MIAPGRWADLLLVDDLQRFRADLVVAKGQIAAESGRLTVTPPEFHYPAWATKSVHLERPLKPQDFVLRNTTNTAQPLAHVIGVSENKLPTRHLRIKVTSADGVVAADMQADIAKVALVQRHKGMSGTTLALVQGFGFTGALRCCLHRCARLPSAAGRGHRRCVHGSGGEQPAKHRRRAGGGEG